MKRIDLRACWIMVGVGCVLGCVQTQPVALTEPQAAESQGPDVEISIDPGRFFAISAPLGLVTSRSGRIERHRFEVVGDRVELVPDVGWTACGRPGPRQSMLDFAVSPGGHIACATQEPGANSSTLYVDGKVGLLEGTVLRLTWNAQGSALMAVIHDGQLGERDAVSRLVVLEPPTETRSPVSGTELDLAGGEQQVQTLWSPTWHPTDEVLAWARRDAVSSKLVLLQPDSGGEPKSFDTGAQGAIGVSFSPEGSSLSWASSSGDTWRLGWLSVPTTSEPSFSAEPIVPPYGLPLAWREDSSCVWARRLGEPRDDLCCLAPSAAPANCFSSGAAERTPADIQYMKTGAVEILCYLVDTTKADAWTVGCAEVGGGRD